MTATIHHRRAIRDRFPSCCGTPGRPIPLRGWRRPHLLKGAVVVVRHSVGVQADEVLDILGALHAAEVRCWISGGWGVDALVHTVTREHRDLDLAVATPSFEAAVDVLAGLGFRPVADWLPVRLEVGGGPGGWVDLHPLAFDENGDGVQSGFDGELFHYPAADLVIGEISGLLVPCISAGLQRTFHSGYEPGPRDLHDLRLLETLIP